MKKTETISQEELKRLGFYNQKTGQFIAKKRRGKIAPGDGVGCKKKNGYCAVVIYRKIYASHRLAFLYMEGYFPENFIDHIDRNPSNNRWDNLREVSPRCNSINCGVSKRNKSNITGVHMDKTHNKWRVQIKTTKRQVCVGYFDNLKDAAFARWAAEKEHNYIKCDSSSSAYRFLEKEGYL